jgi:hypothetical protein
MIRQHSTTFINEIVTHIDNDIIDYFYENSNDDMKNIKKHKNNSNDGKIQNGKACSYKLMDNNSSMILIIDYKKLEMKIMNIVNLINDAFFLQHFLKYFTKYQKSKKTNVKYYEVSETVFMTNNKYSNMLACNIEINPKIKCRLMKSSKNTIILFFELFSNSKIENLMTHNMNPRGSNYYCYIIPNAMTKSSFDDIITMHYTKGVFSSLLNLQINYDYDGETNRAKIRLGINNK